MQTEDYITDLYDYLDRDWSSYGKLRRFKTKQEIIDTACNYFQAHKDIAWMLRQTINIDKEVDIYIAKRKIEMDSEWKNLSYLWERLYDKLLDAIDKELEKYDDEIFEAHNLKMHDAFYEAGNYEHWDELFYNCMEFWYDDFQYKLKEELGQFFDWYKQIEQIGRTSSFYLGNRHTDSNHSVDIADEMLSDIINALPNNYDGAYVSEVWGTRRLELYDRGWDKDGLTDEEVMEKCVDQIIKELPEEIESRLHDQKVIREVLKEYKDNQVQWFKDYVADRAEYDEVFIS